MSSTWGFNWSAYISELENTPWNAGKVTLQFLSRFLPLSLVLSVFMAIYAWIIYVNTKSILVTGLAVFLAGMMMGAQNVIPELQILGVVFAVIGAGVALYDALRG